MVARILVLLCILIPARAAFGQSTAQRPVVESMVYPVFPHLGQKLATEGYVRRAGRLRKGALHAIALQLRAGYRYQISATAHCPSSMELQLYDASNRLLARSPRSGAAAQLSLASRTTAVYRVRIIMWDCTPPSCGYALRLRARRSR
ncbi:hypothetical protein LEM8419_03185 [Neolewinella maritima]|uniref:Uncharacterized protein n=1 Tax=Neolewinella maritima TaxID=1383882 RepID=A0ABM9B4K0_9BACT|nr:hypothetical protein [Neolewinella maritima]CAH1002266.1 hypothetical protein LEM8419_03185 [Neolewinella maritima]